MIINDYKFKYILFYNEVEKIASTFKLSYIMNSFLLKQVITNNLDINSKYIWIDMKKLHMYLSDKNIQNDNLLKQYNINVPLPVKKPVVTDINVFDIMGRDIISTDDTDDEDIKKKEIIQLEFDDDDEDEDDIEPIALKKHIEGEISLKAKKSTLLLTNPKIQQLIKNGEYINVVNINNSRYLDYDQYTNVQKLFKIPFDEFMVMMYDKIQDNTHFKQITIKFLDTQITQNKTEYIIYKNIITNENIESYIANIRSTLDIKRSYYDNTISNSFVDTYGKLSPYDKIDEFKVYKLNIQCKLKTMDILEIFNKVHTTDNAISNYATNWKYIYYKGLYENSSVDWYKIQDLNVSHTYDKKHDPKNKWKNRIDALNIDIENKNNKILRKTNVQNNNMAKFMKFNDDVHNFIKLIDSKSVNTTSLDTQLKKISPPKIIDNPKVDLKIIYTDLKQIIIEIHRNNNEMVNSIKLDIYKSLENFKIFLTIDRKQDIIYHNRIYLAHYISSVDLGFRIDIIEEKYDINKNLKTQFFNITLDDKCIINSFGNVHNSNAFKANIQKYIQGLLSPFDINVEKIEHINYNISFNINNMHLNRDVFWEMIMTKNIVNNFVYFTEIGKTFNDMGKQPVTVKFHDIERTKRKDFRFIMENYLCEKKQLWDYIYVKAEDIDSLESFYKKIGLLEYIITYYKQYMPNTLYDIYAELNSYIKKKTITKVHKGKKNKLLLDELKRLAPLLWKHKNSSKTVQLPSQPTIFETYNEALLYNRLYIYIKSNKNLFDQLVQIIQNEDLNFIHIKGLPIPKLTPNLYTVDNQDIVRLQEHIESDIQLINDNVTTINTGALLKKTEYNELLYVFSENTKWNIAINKYAFDQNGNVMINNKNIIDYTSKLNNKQDISYIDRGLATLKKQGINNKQQIVDAFIEILTNKNKPNKEVILLLLLSRLTSKNGQYIYINDLTFDSLVNTIKNSQWDQLHTSGMFISPLYYTYKIDSNLADDELISNPDIMHFNKLIDRNRANKQQIDYHDNLTTEVNSGSILKRSFINDIVFTFSNDNKWNNLIAIDKYKVDQMGNFNKNTEMLEDYYKKLNNPKYIKYVNNGMNWLANNNITDPSIQLSTIINLLQTPDKEGNVKKDKGIKLLLILLKIMDNEYKKELNIIEDFKTQFLNEFVDEFGNEKIVNNINDLDNIYKKRYKTLNINFVKLIGYQILKYPFSINDGFGEPRYYISNWNPAKRYPGIKESKNRDTVHDIPQGFVKNKLFTNLYIEKFKSGKIKSEKQGTKNYIGTKVYTVLKNNSIGMIPQSIEIFLRRIFDDEYLTFNRIGASSPYRILNCILKAFALENIELQHTDVYDINKIISQYSINIIKQENVGSNDNEILTKYNTFIDSKLFIKWIEKFFDVNIFILDNKSNFEIPQHEKFYIKQINPNKKSILLYRVSDNYDLIYINNNGRYMYVLPQTYTDHISKIYKYIYDIHITDDNIQSILNTEQTLNTLTIDKQYIDKFGKTRIIMINNIMIFTPPITPYDTKLLINIDDFNNLPPIYDVLKLIAQLKFKIISLNIYNDIIKGLNLNNNIYIPVKNINKNILTNIKNIGLSYIINENNTNDIYRIFTNKKISELLKQYSLKYFAIELNHNLHKVLDNNTQKINYTELNKIINDFFDLNNGKILFDTKHEYSYDIKLILADNDTNFIRNDKIIINSSELLEGLKYFIKLELKLDFDKVIGMTSSNEVEHYYNIKNNFIDNDMLFLNTGDPLEFDINDYSKQKNKIINEPEPYIIKINDQNFLVQGTQMRHYEVARNICYNWIYNNYNSGFFTTNKSHITDNIDNIPIISSHDIKKTGTKLSFTTNIRNSRSKAFIFNFVSDTKAPMIPSNHELSYYDKELLQERDRLMFEKTVGDEVKVDRVIHMNPPYTMHEGNYCALLRI